MAAPRIRRDPLLRSTPCIEQGYAERDHASDGSLEILPHVREPRISDRIDASLRISRPPFGRMAGRDPQPLADPSTCTVGRRIGSVEPAYPAPAGMARIGPPTAEA